MDNIKFKSGDLVKYKGDLLTVSVWHLAYGELEQSGAELIESVEERIARFTPKEDEVKPKVGDLIESNGKMKFYGCYSSLFLTEPNTIIETHKERLNRFEHEKGKTPKKEFLIGDLVRCDGKLQVIDAWSGLYITQENSLIVETHDERLARFDTVKSMKKRLKKRAKELGWKTKKAVYLKKLSPKLPMSFEDLPKGVRASFSWTAFPCIPESYQALRKLELLRDAWNGGWYADWDDYNQEKWCISLCDSEEVYIDRYFAIRRFLSFKTEELAEKFYKQFKYLILEAQDLI